MSSATPRTVLVTGAGRRLGREIALALAGSGWQVAIHYGRSADEAVATLSDCRAAAPSLQFEVFPADLADEAQARALVPGVARHFGRLDAVVNNASLFEHDSARSFSFAALQAHVATNTAAPVVLAQALHEHA